jgi:hypothetical protein
MSLARAVVRATHLCEASFLSRRSQALLRAWVPNVVLEPFGAKTPKQGSGFWHRGRVLAPSNTPVSGSPDAGCWPLCCTNMPPSAHANAVRHGRQWPSALCSAAGEPPPARKPGRQRGGAQERAFAAGGLPPAQQQGPGGPGWRQPHRHCVAGRPQRLIRQVRLADHWASLECRILCEALPNRDRVSFSGCNLGQAVSYWFQRCGAGRRRRECSLQLTVSQRGLGCSSCVAYFVRRVWCRAGWSGHWLATSRMRVCAGGGTVRKCQHCSDCMHARAVEPRLVVLTAVPGQRAPGALHALLAHGGSQPAGSSNPKPIVAMLMQDLACAEQVEDGRSG